jgi:hypothetical protein
MDDAGIFNIVFDERREELLFHGLSASVAYVSDIINEFVTVIAVEDASL